MIELILLFLAISASFVNKDERFPALIFSFVDCFFYFAGADIEGAKGYIATGLFDAFTALVLYVTFLHTRDRLSIILLGASILSVLINIYGFAAYESYSEPYVYDSLFELYYLVIIALFITRIKPYVRIRDSRGGARILDGINHNCHFVRESKQ